MSHTILAVGLSLAAGLFTEFLKFLKDTSELTYMWRRANQSQNRNKYGKVFITVVLFQVILVTSCGDQSQPTIDTDKQNQQMDSVTHISATDNRIAVMGRFKKSINNGLRFSYPGVTIKFNFRGKSAFIIATSTTGDNYLDILVDGKINKVVKVDRGETSIILTSDDQVTVHQVEIIHRNETWQGIVTLSNIVITDGDLMETPIFPERRILVVGDSVTCGEAIDREPVCDKNPLWWNPRQSYGMLVAQQLDAQVHLVCYGGRGLIRDWQGNKQNFNAPQFFDLAIPDDASPVKWDHRQYRPDLVVISLGTNDFNLDLGPLPDKAEFVSTYVKFIEKILTEYKKAHIAITEGSIVNDMSDPTRPQKTVLMDYLREVVNKINNDRVSYVTSKYYPGDECDGHPTKSQHASMSTDLLPQLERIMHW